jgi:hypothetical protein
VILSALFLIERRRAPRCGAYKGITEAVLEARRTLEAQSRKEVA